MMCAMSLPRRRGVRGSPRDRAEAAPHRLQRLLLPLQVVLEVLLLLLLLLFSMLLILITGW